MGGGAFAVSLSIGGDAYRFPLAAGALVAITSLIVMVQVFNTRGQSTEPTTDQTAFLPNAVLVVVATLLLPIALTFRIPFAPVAVAFLWIAIIALHPNKKRGAIIGLPVAVVVGFGATLIFRDLLQVDLS